MDGGYGTAPYPVVDIFFTENQQQSAKACNDSNNKNVRKIVKIAFNILNGNLHIVLPGIGKQCCFLYRTDTVVSKPLGFIAGISGISEIKKYIEKGVNAVIQKVSRTAVLLFHIFK